MRPGKKSSLFTTETSKLTVLFVDYAAVSFWGKQYIRALPAYHTNLCSFQEEEHMIVMKFKCCKTYSEPLILILYHWQRHGLAIHKKPSAVY